MANEDKATVYHRLRRRVSVASTAAATIGAVVLLVTGASAWTRDIALVVAPDFWPLAVAVYVSAVSLLLTVLELPLAFYRGVTLERRYGLSTQATAHWLRDYAAGSLLGLVFAITGALLAIALLRWNDEYWWLAATACGTAILVVLAQLAPVVLLPLFYHLKPLDRPALAERLVALASRAGARVIGVFEWRLSDRTRTANAALAGVGRTRRILLSDTLLSEHSDEEIEVILAHEVAHHVYRDIWTTLAVEAVVVGLGLYVADVVLSTLTGSFRLVGKSDMAALPLVVLSAGAVSLLVRPLVNALSRAHERRADRFALELTGNAAAFVTAMRRLAAQNLAEERPSRTVELLFYTHPPTQTRIRAAQAWQPVTAGEPRAGLASRDDVSRS